MSIKNLNPLWIAAALVMVLIIWLASGDVLRAPDEAPDVTEQAADPVTTVAVRESRAQPHQPQMAVQGRVEPWRQIQLIARVHGEVMELPVSQGARVEAGTVLVELDAEERQARVDQLEADLELVETELRGAEQLRAQDLTSQIEYLSLVSDQAMITAELEAAELALRNTRPRAPFDGIFDRRFVEEGDYVQVGQELLHFADISRLRVMAQVPQQDVHQLEVGQGVTVALLDDSQLQGELRHIATVADPETRSFYIEVEVDNPDRRRVAGGSASLIIHLDEVPAHRISPSLLSLDGNGRMVVRFVDDDQRVQEQTVELLSAGRDHAWVKGLPDEVYVITQGAGFVELEQQVGVVSAEED